MILPRTAFISFLSLFLVTSCSGGGDDNDAAAETDSLASSRLTISEVLPSENFLSIINGSTPESRWNATPQEAPDEGCVKLHINNPGYLHKVFNDSNFLHLQAAAPIGISPIESDDDAWREGSRLIKVVSCADFYVDSLKHSYPYLVPEAYRLLHDIGHAFNDSLAARGGGNYRLKVTSLTRTPATVKRLRRVNRNASGESSHTFATTFDISFSRFIYDGGGTPRTFEDLKNLLAEVLLDMRRNQRCYIKHERRQSCFHITARQTPPALHPGSAN